MQQNISRLPRLLKQFEARTCTTIQLTSIKVRSVQQYTSKKPRLTGLCNTLQKRPVGQSCATINLKKTPLDRAVQHYISQETRWTLRNNPTRKFSDTRGNMSDPRNDDKNLWVGWDEYNGLIEKLALQVYDSNWKFDQILCLARGGLRVGDVLSRIFDLPLAVLSTSSYREAAGTEQGRLDISEHVTMAGRDLCGEVLLVDDLVDSGVTIERVQEYLKVRYPKVTGLRFGVLWYKGCSKIKPDYYVQYLPTSPWIHQPFEEYDTVRPSDLKQLHESATRDSKI